MKNQDEALIRAIDAFETEAAFARAVGVKPQAVAQWRRVPPIRVLTVEKISGVPRHELRPDIYPEPAQ